MKHYKWLLDGRRGTHQQGFTWPELGEWVEVAGPLEACRNGLHVVEVQNIMEWLPAGGTLYEVEIDGEHFTHNGEKVVCRRARLVTCLGKPADKTLRLFACDCAEAGLPIYEKACPGNNRPRRAVEVARLFVEGKATREELAAAGAAAQAAAAEKKRQGKAFLKALKAQEGEKP